MSPKRPPHLFRPPVTKEWDPTDTQTLERSIDLAQETQWRRSSVDQLKAIAATLGEVRDLARTNEAGLTIKASKQELTELVGQVALLTERVSTLKHVTWGVLVVFVIAILLQKKGIL